MATKYCPACGAAQNEENTFCTVCGKELDAPADTVVDVLPAEGYYNVMLTQYDTTPEAAVQTIANTCGYSAEDARAIVECVPTLAACNVTLAQARAIRSSFYEEGLTVRVYDSTGSLLVDAGGDLPVVEEGQQSLFGKTVGTIAAVLASLTVANRIRRASIRTRRILPPAPPKRPKLKFVRRPSLPQPPRPRVTVPRQPAPKAPKAGGLFDVKPASKAPKAGGLFGAKPASKAPSGGGRQTRQSPPAGTRENGAIRGGAAGGAAGGMKSGRGPGGKAGARGNGAIRGGAAGGAAGGMKSGKGGRGPGRG